MTLEVAVQRWPVDPKAPSRMARAALSRSASDITMTAFFPPISHVTLAPLEAALTYRSVPIEFEPVKEMIGMSREWTSVSPTSEPEPTTTLKTPGGSPASA